MNTLKNKKNLSGYLKSQQNLEQKLKKSIRRSGFISAICVIFAFALIYVATHQSIYIVPYGLDKKVKVSVNRVDPYYLSILIRNDAQTYFDVTPQSIGRASDIFLERIKPIYFGETQIELKKRKQEYLHDNKSTIFYPENHTEVNGESITIKGNLLTIIGNKITDKKLITLTADYEINNGSVYIKRWSYD